MEEGENEPSLRIEAAEVVKEVLYAVSEAWVSRQLPQSDELAYFNVRTKEGDTFCVQLSIQGFRIVGKAYDVVEAETESPFYETIYALLDHVSPEYRNSFGDALMNKLIQLQNAEGEAK